MVDISPRLVFILSCLAAILVYMAWDRKLERHSILFIRRTEKGIRTIDRVAKRWPRFWKYYGNLGVIVGVLSILLATLMIGFTFVNMFQTGSTDEGPAMILPGLQSETQWQPGITFVPAEYWVITIIILLTVHEMSHGIVARAEDIDLRSVGWIILGVLPLGAFVEPEGENLLPGEDSQDSHAAWDIGDWRSRLRVLCAGSFANYLTAALFLLLALGTVQAVTETTDTEIIGVQLYEGDNGLDYIAGPGGPAYESGMRNGTLVSVGGEAINTLDDVENVTKTLEEGQNISVETSEGIFEVEVASGSIREMRGQFVDYRSAIDWFYSLLITVSMLNFLIGLFNMVPIKPLDGGLAAETFITEFLDDGKLKYFNYFSLGVWILLIGTITGILLGL